MAVPLINGINYSWGNVTLILFGIPIIGITKISYKSAQTKDNNYGAGFKPVSRGYGNITYEGSIEIYTDEWKKIIAASPDRDPLNIPPFDITVLFGGSRVAPDKDVLKMVEFMEDPLDTSQGDSKILVTIPLVIGDIIR